MSEIEAGRLLFFYFVMKEIELREVVEEAARQRSCKVVEIMFNDDDNVFEVTIDKYDAPVDIEDCEFVHRAVLAAFDRNVEDYALTVSSLGIDAGQADEILKTLNE